MENIQMIWWRFFEFLWVELAWVVTWYVRVGGGRLKMVDDPGCPIVRVHIYKIPIWIIFFIFHFYKMGKIYFYKKDIWIKLGFHKMPQSLHSSDRNQVIESHRSQQEVLETKWKIHGVRSWESLICYFTCECNWPDIWIDGLPERGGENNIG
jgi:hypothetical protein